MWWAGSRPDDVYLGTRGFAVCRGVDKLVAHAVTDLEAAFAALSAWLADGASGKRLRIWLSGGLCRPFIVPAVPGVTGEDEWQRVAAAMAPTECGLPGPCQVWLAAIEKQAVHRVAVALEEALLQRLLSVVSAAERKRRLMSIRPWWSEVLRQALQRDPGTPLLAVQDCDALTVLSGVGERFESARTLAPVFNEETADAALARMLLTSAAAEGKELRVRLTLNRDTRSGEVAPLAALTEWAR